jgi:sulfatase modifying factor 1
MRYADSVHPNGVGSVAYSYNIGKTEVTNAQYVNFLNAVAASDPYGLYNANMGTDTLGGITRSGNSGSYAYSVKVPALGGTYTYDNKPVVYVDWGDTARFANWLGNGQPMGAADASTTEAGAYTLNGATSDSALINVTRNAGARWWLPSDNEWYKAAYFNPSTVSYYDYPTSNSTAPNNNPPSNDTGNSANFNPVDRNYPWTDAGAYALSPSPFGTFDQGGNAWEWTDTRLDITDSGSTFSFRFLRGGTALLNSPSDLHASDWLKHFPTNGRFDDGFRVATLSVPEPSAILLIALAMTGLAFGRGQRR